MASGYVLPVVISCTHHVRFRMPRRTSTNNVVGSEPASYFIDQIEMVCSPEEIKRMSHEELVSLASESYCVRHTCQKL